MWYEHCYCFELEGERRRRRRVKGQNDKLISGANQFASPKRSDLAFLFSGFFSFFCLNLCFGSDSLRRFNSILGVRQAGAQGQWINSPLQMKREHHFWEIGKGRKKERKQQNSDWIRMKLEWINQRLRFFPRAFDMASSYRSRVRFPNHSENVYGFNPMKLCTNQLGSCIDPHAIELVFLPLIIFAILTISRL